MSQGTRQDVTRRVGRSPLLSERQEAGWSAMSLEPEGQRENLPLRVVVTVPCLNEKETVGSVIGQVPRNMPGVGDVRVVVIDDGSEDGTAETALVAGADHVIRHGRNRGLGRTFRSGLEASVELGADIIVNIDGDGQYDPTEIPRLLEPILDGRADVVLGNRQLDSITHMPRSRKWGNRMASWVTRRISHLNVRDCQTGFRALTSEAAFHLTLDGDYTYTQEMIVQAAYRDLFVEEVPVTFRRRVNGESRLIRSAWRYALRSGLILLRSYRDHDPLRLFTTLGILFFALGGIAGVRVVNHFLATGSVSPMVPSALFAAAMGIVGLQVLFFGLVADMMKGRRQVDEEILLRLRRRAWSRARASRREED